MRDIKRAEFAAIDAIYNAYMACNATDLDGPSPLAYGRTNHRDAMTILADAARAAWEMLDLSPKDAGEVWDAMCEGGSGAAYAYNYVMREKAERIAAGEPGTLYQKCAYCHLFIERQDEYPGQAEYVHLTRGDDADEAIDSTHEAWPSGQFGTLELWMQFGSPAMRARFSDEDTYTGPTFREMED